MEEVRTCHGRQKFVSVVLSPPVYDVVFEDAELHDKLVLKIDLGGTQSGEVGLTRCLQ